MDARKHGRCPRCGSPFCRDHACPEAEGEAAWCRCREAVTRAYRGMLDSGAPDSVAMEAAVRVYRYHHPHAPEDQSHQTVENWVFTGPLH